MATGTEKRPENSVPSGRPLDAKELATYLDVNVATIYRWVRQQKQGRDVGPPAYKLCGKIRFFEGQVRDWLGRQRLLGADRAAGAR